MLKEERQERELSLLAENRFARVEALSRMLGVSSPTVRRDLTELAGRGKLIRRHGGAVLPCAAEVCSPRGADPPQIRQVLQQIGDGDAVFLDAAAAGQIGSKLCRRHGLTVVTNSPAVCRDWQQEGFRVFCTGGELTETGALVGSVAQTMVSDFCFDVAVLAGCRADENGCVSGDGSEEVALYRAVKARSRRTVLMENHRDRPGIYRLMTTAEADVIISADVNETATEKEGF